MRGFWVLGCLSVSCAALAYGYSHLATAWLFLAYIPLLATARNQEPISLRNGKFSKWIKLLNTPSFQKEER